MSQYMMGEGIHVLRCVALGFFLGFLKDFSTSGRKGRKIPIRWYVQDGVYWGVAALLVFLRMMQDNDGEIRIYGIMGVAAGSGIYVLVAYPYIHPVLKWVRKITKNTVFFCLKRLLFAVERCKLLIHEFIWKCYRFYQKREQQVGKKQN